MIENLKLYKIYKHKAFFFCPWHKSSKGTADLCVDLDGEYVGRFYCWSCKKFGTVPKEDIEKLLKLRGEVKEDKKVTDWSQLNLKYMSRRREVLSFPPLKVRLDVLANLGWGWDGTAHTFPERNVEDQIIGIHRRFPDRRKGVVSGSRRGLTIPRINFDCHKPFYVCEGLSDLSVVLECGYQGIAIPSANGCLEMAEQWINKHIHSDTYITIVADNDSPGIDSAKELSNKLACYEHVVYDIPPCATDLYDYFLEHGLEETKKWLA